MDSDIMDSFKAQQQPCSRESRFMEIHNETMDSGFMDSFKAQQQPSPRESRFLETLNETMDSGFMDFHNTTQDSLRSQKETKTPSIAITDKYYDSYKAQHQPSPRESRFSETLNETMDFIDFHNTTQDSLRSQKETKTPSIAVTDKYYDYSGPQSGIMKKLSMESLSR